MDAPAAPPSTLRSFIISANKSYIEKRKKAKREREREKFFWYEILQKCKQKGIFKRLLPDDCRNLSLRQGKEGHDRKMVHRGKGNQGTARVFFKEEE